MISLDLLNHAQHAAHKHPFVTAAQRYDMVSKRGKSNMRNCCSGIAVTMPNVWCLVPTCLNLTRERGRERETRWRTLAVFNAFRHLQASSSHGTHVHCGQTWSNCVWLHERRCQCQHRCRCRERRLPRRRTRRGQAARLCNELLWVAKRLWVEVIWSHHPQISKNLQQSSTNR